MKAFDDDIVLDTLYGDLVSPLRWIDHRHILCRVRRLYAGWRAFAYMSISTNKIKGGAKAVVAVLGDGPPAPQQVAPPVCEPSVETSVEASFDTIEEFNEIINS